MVQPSIRQTLQTHGVWARKELGQNFLTDRACAQRIVAASGVGSEDRVVEIGPGLGSLTGPLLDAVQAVTVIERDGQLVPLLRERLQERWERMRLIQDDALRVDFTQLAQELGGPLRIVANLPYSISTPILFHLLDHRQAIHDMTLMFQKEVADRIVAPPGGKIYGTLSVHCGLWCRMQRLFLVPPQAFHPMPKVTSAVVRLELLTQPSAPVGDVELFGRVVKAAFMQRRKTLHNALSVLGGDSKLWFAATGIDPQRRGETLSVAEFVALARAVEAGSSVL